MSSTFLTALPSEISVEPDEDEERGESSPCKLNVQQVGVRIEGMKGLAGCTETRCRVGEFYTRIEYTRIQQCHF